MQIIKGQNCTLSNHALLLSLDWQLCESASIEIDHSLFLLSPEELVTEDADFIFYNQPTSSKGRAQYVTAGDAHLRDGKAGFLIDLDALPSSIASVAIVVSCDDSHDSGLSLSALEWAALDIQTSSGRHLVQYEFHGDVHSESSIVVGMIYRHSAAWKFRAVGQGFTGGLSALATHFGVALQAPCSHSASPTVEQPAALTNQVPALKKRLDRFLRDIVNACKIQENETKTRMILDRIFQEVLGYRMENIEPEQNVQGRRADYVLSVDGEAMLVVEVKRAGSALRDRQIFQATAYGAYAGIRWALLTNLMEWQLYRISTNERVEAHLVFTVSLQDGLSNDSAYHLALISHDGFRQKELLDGLYRKISILSYENLVVALLNQEVISRMRAILSHQAGQDLTQDEVQSAIERNLLRL